jgi:hypothetical protein
MKRVATNADFGMRNADWDFVIPQSEIRNPQSDIAELRRNIP